MNESINSLYFNDIEVEEDFRSLLSSLFTSSYFYDVFDDEVNFLPMDINASKQVDLPAVTIQIIPENIINSDNSQKQRYCNFTIQLDIYTSGDDRVYKNRILCNEIIRTLQSSVNMEHYYNKGLTFENNTQVGTMLDSAYRRVVRMSGICDNEKKIIKGEMR